MYNEYIKKISIIFEWSKEKEAENIKKHGVSFEEAKTAFYDERRVLTEDPSHSEHELRYFCIGQTKRGILTVRFTLRGNCIRIFGAGYWRKQRRYYEQENR